MNFDKQNGFISFDGFFTAVLILSIFGIVGIFSLFFWIIPSIWQWLKPWLHLITG